MGTRMIQKIKQTTEETRQISLKYINKHITYIEETLNKLI